MWMECLTQALHLHSYKACHNIGRLELSYVMQGCANTENFVTQANRLYTFLRIFH